MLIRVMLMLWLAVVRQHADVIISDIDKNFQTFRCTYVAVLVAQLDRVYRQTS